MGYCGCFSKSGLADEDRPTERVLCRNAQDLLRAFGERGDIIHDAALVRERAIRTGHVQPIARGERLISGARPRDCATRRLIWAIVMGDAAKGGSSRWKWLGQCYFTHL
jgi:hypothetical protein